ncbi:MAG: DNA gyrase modulator, partial [Gemmatimonadales bacterium]|nr:DNA gyrase modulator [Gemmatimonadales bacterium]
MALTRREFVKQTSAAAAAAGLVTPAMARPLPQADASVRELALLALDAARSAGASYADVRVHNVRNQSVSTRENRVTGLNDGESFGFGVRVLVNGAWGFSASSDLSRVEVQRVARAA